VEDALLAILEKIFPCCFGVWDLEFSGFGFGFGFGFGPGFVVLPSSIF